MNRLAELHGSMFVEKCSMCQAKVGISIELFKMLRSEMSILFLFPVHSVQVFHHNRIQVYGPEMQSAETPRHLQVPGVHLSVAKVVSMVTMSLVKRGDVQDTILDWEDSLPAEEMVKSELNCKKADLCICLGTTLQIMPVGNYPMLTKKNNGKIVTVNLQETRIEKHADLVINQKLDRVFQLLFDKYLKALPNPYPEIKMTQKIQVCLRLPMDDASTTPSKSTASQTLLSVSNVVIDPWYSSQEGRLNSYVSSEWL